MARKSKNEDGGSAMDILVPAAGAIVGSAVNPLGGPVGAALGKAGVSLYRRGAAKAAERRAEQAELEFESFLAENPDLAAKVVPEDPEQQELFLLMYRSALASIDSKAIGPLVRITAQYIGREKDRFFLDTAKLFEELIGTDFDALKELLDACLEAPEEVEWILATATDSTVEPKNIKIEWTTRTQGQAEPERASTHVEVGGGGFVRLVVALKRHAIANESVAGVAGAKSGPGIMVVRRETARRVRVLLGP